MVCLFLSCSYQSISPRFVLNDEWDKQIGNSLFVFNPVIAVLLLAHMIVTNGPVNEEDQKIDRLEIGDWRIKSTEQAPGESHQPVAWFSMVRKGRGDGLTDAPV
jgi:hypothetical protein